MTDLTIGFYDLAGFTALTEAHGDEEAVRAVEHFVDVARASLGVHDQLVKSIGDAVMIVYPDPDAALAGAERLFIACLSEDGFAVPRAGLHHGAVVPRGDDYFGAAVNLAARVAGEARGAQLLGTRPVAEAARAAGLTTVDLGPVSLRNIQAPVELSEIQLVETAGDSVIDPVCCMRITRASAAGNLRFRQTEWWFCSLDCAATFAAAPGAYAGSPG